MHTLMVASLEGGSHPVQDGAIAHARPFSGNRTPDFKVRSLEVQRLTN